METGIFISVEGPDGSGKSSMVAKLAALLEESCDREVFVTREPGGDPVAERIRELILTRDHEQMDDRTEALLFAAGRRQHVTRKIVPALERGAIVLCDRFVDSSIAYQGSGRELGMDEVAQLNDFATDGLTPDLTLYLDLDVQIGLDRIGHHSSNREKDRLELEALAFHERVRSGYLKLLDAHPHRIKKIQADQAPEDVLADSWQVVEAFLKQQREQASSEEENE